MSFFKRLIPMKGKVWVTLDKPSFQEGETVVGRVNLEANEYVRGEEVRVEARVFENYSEMVRVQRGNEWVWERQNRKEKRWGTDVRVSGPADFGPGSGLKNFPFNVNVPPHRPAHEGGSIEYNVKGVVAVKGRPDVTGETALGFLPPAPPIVMVQAVAPTAVPAFAQTQYSGPGPMQAQYVQPVQAMPVTQVITKEVVKVRCSYCKGLMDITENRCPNCGAAV